MVSREDRIFYPYLLDYKPAFFLGLFLQRLFKRVDLDESIKESLRQLQKQGTLVYAIKYRGKSDFLLQHYSFRSRELPYPKIAFDLNLSMLLPFGQFVKTAFSQLRYASRHGKFPNPYETGFYKEAIQQGIPSLISLIDPKGFTQLKRTIFSFSWKSRRKWIDPFSSCLTSSFTSGRLRRTAQGSPASSLGSETIRGCSEKLCFSSGINVGPSSISDNL
jgi:hypothetical protein